MTFLDLKKGDHVLELNVYRHQAPQPARVRSVGPRWITTINTFGFPTRRRYNANTGCGEYGWRITTEAARARDALCSTLNREIEERVSWLSDHGTPESLEKVLDLLRKETS